MAVQWGHDPTVGNVVIVGKCDYHMYTIWKILQGLHRFEVPDKCFEEYSVYPKDDTPFLICFREAVGDLLGKRFLHIAPEAAVRVGEVRNNQEENG